MFGIGQFAQLAKVSVRTLRHYDEVGLLRPAHVDGATGYRSYRAAQLADLNHILVLKDLGFTLAEITRMTEAGIATSELVGMLRLRQAEAQRAAEAEQQRLSRVAARIDLLNGATEMTETTTAVVVKPLDAVRLATTTETITGFDVDLTSVFARLYGALEVAVTCSGVRPNGPNIAFYTERPDGQIDVHAGVPVRAEDAIDCEGVAVHDLPAVARAATLVHTGDMSECARSYDVLQRWVEATGEQAVGLSREVYLDCSGGRGEWVTELQFVLA